MTLATHKKHKQIKVVQQENQGSSVARNKGIELARGRYIYFVDSDDFVASSENWNYACRHRVHSC